MHVFIIISLGGFTVCYNTNYRTCRGLGL